MRTAIAGAHGQIGLRLVRILAARGEEVLGLIRNPDHAADVTAAGGEPLVCDLERASTSEVTEAIGRAERGAGPSDGVGILAAAGS
jgi:nucleoside-diphosphate-sugar epimerase